MAQVQEMLAGRYELLEVVGRGGMGVVYRAADNKLMRPVAVKVPAIERADDQTFLARFEREALAVAALSHPNIVAIYDSGVDGETRFIVMEYVEGASLAEVNRRRAPLAPREAAAIAAQVAGALGAAHRAGIIHRDIKPANVMLNDGGAVKVLDFGIARAAADASLTRTAMVLGSASYIAPEITRGETAGAQSDIYSLGCVLYEMLTGRPPFTAELPAAVMHQHNAAIPAPAGKLNPAVPAALDALVMQMLAKRRDQRPRDARELAQALSAAVTGGPRRTPAAATAPLTHPTRIVRAPRGRFARLRTAVLAVAVAIVVAGVAAALTGSSAVKHGRVLARPSAAHGAVGSATVPTTVTRPAPVTPAASPPAAPAAVRPAHGRGPDGAGPPGHARGAHQQGHGHGDGGHGGG